LSGDCSGVFWGAVATSGLSSTVDVPVALRGRIAWSLELEALKTTGWGIEVLRTEGRRVTGWGAAAEPGLRVLAIEELRS